MECEIGPGKHPVNKDWFIIDMVDKPWVDLRHDVRKLPLPIEDNCFNLIYMSHVLEHVPWFQTVDVLKELKRILQPKGVLEIWVPDLKKLVTAYLEGHMGGDKWRKFNKENDPVKWFNGRLFTYGPNDENWHRAAFDTPYLIRCLKQAGFNMIKPLQYPRGYDHGWINLGMAGVKE